jgi:phage tail sheath protein FI
MIAIKKTPGVYIEEISILPPGIAAVDTAVPVFIGYTDKIDGKLQAVKISSLLEFEELYCSAGDWTLTFNVKDDSITESFSQNQLYYHMQLYFANGGGKCYVISLGKRVKNSKGEKNDYLEAIKVLEKEDEPTIIVMPEAAQLTHTSCMDVYQAALMQAAKLMDRFVVMDIPETDDEIKKFRDGIGANNLQFGAAYYPNLNTTISKYSKVRNQDIIFKETTTDKDDKNPKTVTKEIEPGNMNRQKMIQNIKSRMLTLSPSAAIAGVYATVDGSRGVWKAPANVSLQFVSGPDKKISHEEQGELNVHPEGGKSINAIRTFSGKGTMVWGARTLAGNDNEWRYVNVRRFYNFAEESIKTATQQFVFEPNDANTWVRVSTMIENFLTNLWRQGALAGATPTEAFYVKVGLGVTMTAEDILNGIMNVEIGLAVVRPAEFITLKFSQKMQES